MSYRILPLRKGASDNQLLNTVVLPDLRNRTAQALEEEPMLCAKRGRCWTWTPQWKLFMVTNKEPRWDPTLTSGGGHRTTRLFAANAKVGRRVIALAGQLIRTGGRWVLKLAEGWRGQAEIGRARKWLATASP